MQFGSYSITCQFESSASLGKFKGSALRGAFGYALRKVCCAQRRQQCEQCLLAGTCAYSYIFETHKDPATSSKMSSRPHPYVLYFPDNGKNEFQPGEQFSFMLLLFGDKAIGMLPYIIYAILQMGNSGLGRGNKSGAGRFILKNVQHEDTLIYDDNHKEFNHAGEMPALMVNQNTATCSGLKVQFLSPLRMKYNQKFVKTLDFQTLIRAALRRVSSLEDAYGEGYPDLDYKGLIDQAAEIDSKLEQTKWQETTRYSNRQKQQMNFGGIIGQAIYQGNITAFMPILHYCAQTHLGKQTAFGLGKITLEPQP